MLVLGIKEGERVLLGEDIVISVERISHDKVRLGFEAPKEKTILREKVYLRALAAITQSPVAPNGSAVSPAPSSSAVA